MIDDQDAVLYMEFNKNVRLKELDGQAEIVGFWGLKGGILDSHGDLAGLF